MECAELRHLSYALIKLCICKLTNSVFNLRSLTPWHCPYSPAARHCCLKQAVLQLIDIICPPDPQQQTCSSGFAAMDAFWDIRTVDTAYRYIDPDPHTRGGGSNLKVGAHGERGARVYKGVWGRSPQRSPGAEQSPWSGGQGAKPR